MSLNRYDKPISALDTGRDRPSKNVNVWVPGTEAAGIAASPAASRLTNLLVVGSADEAARAYPLTLLAHLSANVGPSEAVRYG